MLQFTDVMPALLLVSPKPFSGKTAIAAGLQRRLRGTTSAGDLTISEAPGGDVAETLAANPGVRAIIIATPDVPAAEIANHVRSAGPVSGVILNRVPPRRINKIRVEYEALGVHPLAIIPEDRELASPTIGQLADALKSVSDFLDEHRDDPLDRPVIASIAADPGQAYFTRTQSEAVIVRSDKPDLQLAALNAGTSCLIVTGGLPILSYVGERVADDEIPLLRTEMDTKQTVEVLEELFGNAPFIGEQKTKRIAALLGDLDLDALLERSAGAV